MFINPKYVIPKPDGVGFRPKSDSDTCLKFDAGSLLSDHESVDSAGSIGPVVVAVPRPRSAPCKETLEKLASPVLVFGSGFSDSEDEEVVVTLGSS